MSRDQRLNGAMPLVPRPTPAERYLAVAADLARQGGADAWAHLTSQVHLPELADRLGVSRTALYRHWPTRRDFWTDLATYLALGNDFTQPAAVLPWHQPLAAFTEPCVSAVGPLETVRRIQNELQQIVVADVKVVVRAAQLAFAEMPELADVRARVEQHRIAELAHQIDGRLHKESLRLAPPATAHDLAVTMWCVTDGLAVLNWYLPEVANERVLLDDGTGPRPWGVLGFAYRALLLGLTAPVAAGDAPAPAAAPAMGPLDVPPPSERWTARQCEALAAATTMLLERLVAARPDGQLDLLGHVTVNRIARAAGVSRRAVYDVWPTRDALVLDLLTTLLDDDIDRTIAVFDAASEAAGRSGSPSSLGRILDALIFDDDRSARVAPGHELQQTVLAVLPQAHRPAINSILRGRHDRLVDALAPRIEAVVGADGARLRPDVTTEQLTLTFLALETGAHRILRSNPLAARRPTSATPSTFGSAADALAATSVTSSPT